MQVNLAEAEIWLPPWPKRSKQPIAQVGWKIGIEWEARGPTPFLDRALRIDYYPWAYQSATPLPDFPATEAQSGFYVRWMAPRTAVAVVAVIALVKTGSAILAGLEQAAKWILIFATGG